MLLRLLLHLLTGCAQASVANDGSGDGAETVYLASMWIYDGDADEGPPPEEPIDPLAGDMPPLPDIADIGPWPPPPVVVAY